MQELRGMPVVRAMMERLQEEIERLKKEKVEPNLTIVRVGEREDDLSYEQGIHKRFAMAGAKTQTLALSLSTTQKELEEAILQLNQDQKVHGILIFRPLPPHLDEKRIASLLEAKKDVDGMTAKNLAQVFAGEEEGYPPCTPQAVMEILEHYGINVCGKKVVIIGRSMVVGRPLSMLLLHKHATITICHTKTQKLKEECLKADILVVCAGVPKLLKKDFVKEGQIVIDVGIHVTEEGLCGDVDQEQVREVAKMLTPVPGGVGSVTTAVLLKHVLKGARARLEERRGKERDIVD